jgi:hypothetical protein
MMRRTVLKRVGIGFSTLFLVTALGLGGCAYDQQVKADREAAELAAKKADAAAARAEAAAAKCEKAFEKGLRK